MILKQDAYFETSLGHDIETLSSKKVEPLAAVLANIISKYIISFVLRENPHRGMHYADYREKIGEILDTLRSRDNVESTIKGVKYQLEMALDIPATIEIMTDIIEEIERKGTSDTHFHGLDLGSGSGILMLAQYIGARRIGKNKASITGVEMDYSAQGLSNSLIQSIGVGEVIRGDSRKGELYPTITPNFISNENLSTRGIPFRYIQKDKSDKFEPFIENNDMIGSVYGGDIFRNAGFFPRGITSGNVFDNVESPGLLASDMYGVLKMKMMSVGYDPAMCNYPVKMLIGNAWKGLDDIGVIALPRVFHGTRLFRRWGHISEMGLGQIHALQRAYIKAHPSR